MSYNAKHNEANGEENCDGCNTEMNDADWNTSHARCLGMGLPGDQITEQGERGERIVGDTFVLLFNAYHELIDFRLGARRRDVRWTCVFDTAAPDASEAGRRSFEHMAAFPLQARSLAVLRADISPTATS